jgi:hypothetical protein
VCAFVIVSSVVNVFDDTMKSVSAGSQSIVASTKSVPSTFETKRQRMSRSLNFRSASYAMTGPRSEPPMPMLTDRSLMRFPVWPSHFPAADRVREHAHALEDLVDLRHDVLAVDDDRPPARAHERRVQHGPVLGDVDLVAAEHGLDALPKPRFLGEREEELQRLVVTRCFE